MTTPEPPAPPVLDAEQTARVSQAVLDKATRILSMAEAPLGVWGELTEFGIPTVKPDYTIQETLFGLMFKGYVLEGGGQDFGSLVTPEDVIRQGLQTDPDTFPADRLPDVDRAIDAAGDWVKEYLRGGVGVA